MNDDASGGARVLDAPAALGERVRVDGGEVKRPIWRLVLARTWTTKRLPFWPALLIAQRFFFLAVTLAVNRSGCQYCFTR
jgi:hypothetical protein